MMCLGSVLLNVVKIKPQEFIRRKEGPSTISPLKTGIGEKYLG